MLGPQEFATGLARGVKSFLGHSIGKFFCASQFYCDYIVPSYPNVIQSVFFAFLGGTAGAMSKITGTFGQAFASMSFDKDYRRVTIHAKKYAILTIFYVLIT